MSVELRNILVRSGGRPLPATLLFDYPSLDALARYLARKWRLEADTTDETAAEADAVSLRCMPIAELSDKEAEVLLVEELELSDVGRTVMKHMRSPRRCAANPDQACAGRNPPICARSWRRRKSRVASRSRLSGWVCGFRVARAMPRASHSYLWSGDDAVTEIPADRWSLDAHYEADPDAPGKDDDAPRRFLEQVDEFDAAFFGISPREAASMDPQQRLLLEVAWEALEDAGMRSRIARRHAHRRLLGIANGDYGRALFAHPDLIDRVRQHRQRATASRPAGLSYVLGLHGPSLAVDTACSSSLVAVHLACQSLRQGECDLALAGGVNLILSPEINIELLQGADAGARRPLQDLRRRRRRLRARRGLRRGRAQAAVATRWPTATAILAVIRGTAVNQDGRSNGLTAPNGPAQEAVIRARARGRRCRARHEVGYVEAHGTGTPLGDPIEVAALGCASCAEGRDRADPLLIGSVKTNIGHLEAAAGIAGLIKVVLALSRRRDPAAPALRRRQPA